MRPSGRAHDQLRDISLTRQYTKHAEGSVLVKFGDTHVLCTASIIEGVPRFLKGMKQGWLTAEYGMLPRATSDRTDREAVKGKQGGRTQEIQRLIGRSLRSVVDLTKMGEYTITIDCDVLQADGGTRTAAITGGCVALVDALVLMQHKGLVKQNPFKQLIAAISVGLYQGIPVLDLDYAEDSNAETDMNIIMNSDNGIIEIQGTAEKGSFQHQDLHSLLDLATGGIQELFKHQKEVLGWV